MWNKILIISLYFSCAQYFLTLIGKMDSQVYFCHLLNKFYAETEKSKYVL